MSRLSSSNKLRRIALIAVFGALAYVLMLVVHFKVSFLTLDLKDTAITLAGLYFGPGAALSLSVLVPLLELVSVSDTGLYGFLMNFISTSISYKKREIGILRAVGARSSDVFKIFFSEAFIIALINFMLAVATSIAAVLVLNYYMRNSGINITLLSFGAVQVAIMLGVSTLVAALASFLPVRSIARKKPVDAIKDR